MLATLRKLRHMLAGALGLLLLSSWLSLAAAACVDGVMGHAGMAGMSMDHAAMDMEMPMSGDCPHCVEANSPCIDSGSDCELPPALIPSQPDQPDLLAAAAPLLPEAGLPPVQPETLSCSDPPLPAGRSLHVLNCSFQE